MPKAAEIDQRNMLVLLEVSGKTLVLAEGYDGRIVAQECEHCCQRGHARHVEYWAHNGTEQALKEVHYAKLNEYLAQGSGDDAHAHEVKYGVEQEVVCRVHDGVEHVGESHNITHITKEQANDNEAGNAVWNLFKHMFLS